MTHIITGLCLRDGACVEVCPVECIVPGPPDQPQWPWFYIDPDTCIDCGACVPECPYEAIFPEDDLADEFEVDDGVEYVAADGEKMTGPVVVDLVADAKPNYAFFEDGPGYWDGWEDYLAERGD